MALAKYHADRQRRLDRLLAGDPPDRPAALAALRAQHSQANRSCALADTLAGELLRDRDGHDGMDTSVLASTLPDRLEAAVAFVQEQLTKAESKCSGLMGAARAGRYSGERGGSPRPGNAVYRTASRPSDACAHVAPS